MTARVFCLIGAERTTTDESKPLEIEICDLCVELEDTEMTSWSGSGGPFLAAFFRPGSFAGCIDVGWDDDCCCWEEEGPAPLSLRGKKLVSFWFGFSTFLNFMVECSQQGRDSDACQ